VLLVLVSGLCHVTITIALRQAHNSRRPPIQACHRSHFDLKEKGCDVCYLMPYSVREV
jgi:hypothetical protein